MNMTGKFLRLTGVGVFLLGLAALVVVMAPEVRGQATRTEPLSVIRTQLLGGSQIGVSLRDVDEADVEREGLRELAGAVVEEVQRDSPAAEAGFRAGDVVITFDGERVRSAKHLSRLVDETPEGREVQTTIVRAGNQQTLTVAPAASAGAIRLARSPALREYFNFEFPERLAVEPERLRLMVLGRPRLGVTVNELTDQLAEHFGATSGGVLVVEVDEDTPAARAGLKAGDVITRVAGEPVESPAELQRRLARLTGEVTIDIVRDRQAQTIRADLGERGEDDLVREVRRIRR